MILVTTPNVHERRHGSTLPVLMALALGSVAIGSEYVYDAVIAIPASECVRGELPIAESVLRNVWCEEVPDETRSWRPLAMLCWRLLWALGGGASWIFQAASALAYGLVTAAVVQLARTLACPPRVARNAGLLFAVLAVHADLVASIVGLAALGCSWFAIHALRASLHPGRRAPHVFALTVLSMLTHEMGVLLVPVLWVGFALRRIPSPRARRALTICVTVTLGALACLLLRGAAVGASGPTPVTWPVNPFVRMSPFERVVDGVGLIGRYLWRGIMPGPMSIDYAFASPGLGDDRSWAFVALGLTMCTSLLAAAFALRRSRPTVTWLILWLLGSLLFISNILFPLPALFGERMLLDASIPLSILLALAFEARTRLSPLLRMTAGALAALLVVTQFASFAVHAFTWRRGALLMERSLVAAPDNARLLASAARFAIGLDMPEIALEHATRGAQILPEDPIEWALRGAALDRLGRDAEALQSFERALRLGPQHPEVAEHTIQYWLRRDDRPSAQRVYDLHVRAAGGTAHFQVTNPSP